MFRLIVKGNRFQAAAAAAARGVPFVFRRESDAREVYADTSGATNADLNTLNRWFCEPPNMPPFPVGSLLCFWKSGIGVPQFASPSFAARLHGCVIGYYATAEEADTALVVAINSERAS